MSKYIAVFEWPAATGIPAQSELLVARSEDEAKIQAAVLYGCEPFPHGLPTRYRVFDPRGGLVFCFPDDD